MKIILKIITTVIILFVIQPIKQTKNDSLLMFRERMFNPHIKTTTVFPTFVMNCKWTNILENLSKKFDMEKEFKSYHIIRTPIKSPSRIIRNINLGLGP